MDDRDIQALLDKYRPAQPSPELHVSIHRLTNSPIHELTWPWTVAAAVLLLAAIGLHLTAAPSESPGDRAQHERRIQTVTAALGGTGTDRLLAETLVADEERTLADAERARRPSELTQQ